MLSIHLPSSYTDIHDYLNDLTSFLKNHSYFWEYHSANFFLEEFWDKKIPDEWKSVLLNMSYQELLDMATFGLDSNQLDHWPTSLINYIQTCRSLSLPRNPKSDPYISALIQNKIHISKFMSQGMSTKKKHEVETFATLIQDLCTSHGISNVLDLGAGQGYLDYVLAYVCGKTVLGVDDNSIQTCGAIKRSEKAFNYTLKNIDSNPSTIGKLYHINRRVDANESFLSLLSETESEFDPNHSFLDGTNQSKWLMVGLHTCGDLATDSMKHFMNSDASCLVNIGCCYNRLTERMSPKEAILPSFGFPKSEFVKKSNIHLGHAARGLACQSTCRWSTQTNAIENYTQHYHRALLQFMVIDLDIFPGITDTRDIIVGHLSKGCKNKGWIHYAKQVFKKWGKECPSDSILQAYDERMKKNEMEIAIIWTLRALLASCIESLILVDRVVWLNESYPTLDVELLPLFDEVHSPRNMCILCRKRGWK